MSSNRLYESTSEISQSYGNVSVEDALPVQVKTEPNTIASDIKITKIEIITKQSKFEALKAALNEIGVQV